MDAKAQEIGEFMRNTRKWAIRYHELGWVVLPVPYASKKRKTLWISRPETPQSLEEVKTLFNGLKNISVVPGPASGGLTILDFDTPEFYEQWKHDYPEDAATLPTVKTSRGFHIYFRSNLTKMWKVVGGEVKASGYVMAPPSKHPSGKYYTWEIEPTGDLPFRDPFAWKTVRLTQDTQEPHEIQSTQDVQKVHESHEPQDTSAKRSEGEGFPDKQNPIRLEDLSPEVKNRVDEAIKSTLPLTQGTRNFWIFNFCRWLKAIPELENLQAKRLKLVVQEWHRQALPYIITKEFDETWAEFCYAWTRVKYPKGAGKLKLAVEKALRKSPQLKVLEGYDDKTKLLIQVGYELQRLQGDEPFYLSARDAGNILGMSHEAASKRLIMLVEEGIFELVRVHPFWGKIKLGI